MKKTARSLRRSRTRAAPARSHRVHPAVRAADILIITLARVLIALREHVGLTQEELAARAGVPLPAVRAYETAALTAKFDDFFRLCPALGCDYICVLYEAERRMEAAGTRFIDDLPVPAAEAFVEERCSGRSPITPEECRRQLRLLETLILPDTPAYEDPKPATRQRWVKK